MRRKLYHLEISRPNAPPIHPHNSIAQPLDSFKQPLRPLAQLERVMGNADVPTLRLTELPQALKQKMKRSSDPHLRLDMMLDFKEPLRISTNHLAQLIRIEFGVGLDDIGESVSDRTVAKIIRFYLMHREYNLAGGIVHQMLMDRGNDIQFVQLISATILTTLKSERDLALGIYDICKSLYQHCNTDVKLFKFCYTSLTNNGELLKQSRCKHHMFLDVLKIVQLDAVIQSCQEVSILPRQYWTTGFQYIDVTLATKLPSMKSSLEHLTQCGLIGSEGVFSRLVKTTSDKTFIALELLKHTANLGAYDQDVWRRINSSPIFYKNCFKAITTPSLLHRLQSLYLLKLIKQRKVKTARQLVIDNLNHIRFWEVSSLITLILATKDDQLYRTITANLPPSVRAVLLDLSLKRTYAEMKKTHEPTPPESQIAQIDWLLDGVHYQLRDANLDTLASFLYSLPHVHRMEMLKKIKGPSYVPYASLIKRCKSLALCADLLTMNVFRSRSERMVLCEILLAHFSMKDISSFFAKLSVDHFNSLHPKLTQCLLKSNRAGLLESFLMEHPHEASQLMFNTHILTYSPALLGSLKPKTPIESVQLQTYSRLMDSSRLYLDQSLRLGIKQLKRNKKNAQGPLSILILKQCIERTRMCNRGKVVMNERLRWAKSQCERFKVPSGVVEGMMR